VEYIPLPVRLAVAVVASLMAATVAVLFVEAARE